MLFSELTPARVDLLDTLRRVGPCSVYALAKAAERNDSNVHTDVTRLDEFGLIERMGVSRMLAATTRTSSEPFVSSPTAATTSAGRVT